MSTARAETLRIRLLRAQDAEQLADLFSDLARDPESEHFHPHPFTNAEAARIAERRGILKDLYFGAFLDERLVGYGMLRGWDEGYLIPSFGIAVARRHRSGGIGRRLLLHAVSLARASGAETMMLKVHPANANAKHLYESVGFSFDPVPLNDGQVKGLLAL